MTAPRYARCLPAARIGLRASRGYCTHKLCLYKITASYIAGGAQSVVAVLVSESRPTRSGLARTGRGMATGRPSCCINPSIAIDHSSTPSSQASSRAAVTT